MIGWLLLETLVKFLNLSNFSFFSCFNDVACEFRCGGLDITSAKEFLANVFVST